MPSKARTRIEKAKGLKRLRVQDYQVRNSDGFVTKVLCKRCGDVIREVRPVAEPFEDGTVPVALVTLSHYAEVKIAFDDGSAHITAACLTCARKGWTEDDLEALYSADLEQWIIEEQGPELVNRWAERKPLKVVAISRTPEKLYGR